MTSTAVGSKQAQDLRVGDIIEHRSIRVRVADIHNQEGVANVLITLRNLEGKPRFAGYVSISRFSPVNLEVN
jgi:hypothetical protein